MDIKVLTLRSSTELKIRVELPDYTFCVKKIKKYFFCKTGMMSCGYGEGVGIPFDIYCMESYPSIMGNPFFIFMNRSGPLCTLQIAVDF